MVGPWLSGDPFITPLRFGGWILVGISHAQQKGTGPDTASSGHSLSVRVPRSRLGVEASQYLVYSATATGKRGTVTCTYPSLQTALSCLMRSWEGGVSPLIVTGILRGKALSCDGHGVSGG